MTSQLSTTSPEVFRVVWLGLAPVSFIGTISKYEMASLAGLVPYVKPKNQKPVETEGAVPPEPPSTC